VRRLYVARSLCVVAQNVAQLPNAVFEDGIANERGRPYSIKQLLLGDQSPVMVDQIFEDSECLGPEGNCSRVLPNTLVWLVQPERTEPDLPLHNPKTLTLTLDFLSRRLFSAHIVRDCNKSVRNSTPKHHPNITQAL
jgi:hypothetical protein